MTNFFKPFFFKAKNLLIFSFGLTILITCTSCTPQLSPEFSQMGPQIPVIPAPAFVQNKPGKFRIIPGFRILSTQKDMEARKIINSFAEKLRQINGLDVPIIAGSEIEFRDNMMVIELAAEKSHLGNEGYELEIDPNSMSIQAYKPAGLFYGVQTLLQLLPPELETGQNLPGFNQMTLPCMKIIDTPRFPYRGMHLDVGRHFFPVSFIKKYIDLLALHKFNTFHWHLTEDQGWRIEIKKYPGLSDISSTRNETLVGHYRDQPHKYDGQPHGGVYTQQEIRDVVQYALDRFITIIPEIEMPGHSVAALAAYPELSCTGGSFDVSTIWGVKEDVYCAGNEKVFEFLENVLSEVIDLFPSQYIHIGGDECPKIRWENCEKCQARIQEEGLADENELQSYFIRRIEKFILSKGRKLIGWDEILEGGLAPEATVMSWRGMSGGIEAARQGHDVIMTPVSFCYFDYYQANSKTEPLAIGGLTTLKKIYSFEPVPQELSEKESKHIKGAQGNVWTEYIKTPEYAEYMSVPRMTALSEVVWSPKKSRNWEYFRARLENFFKRLDILDINYSLGSYKVDILSRFDPKIKKTWIDLESEQFDVPIIFSTGESHSSPEIQEFDRPFTFDRTMTIRAGIYIDGNLKDDMSEQTFFYHKGVNKTINLLTPFSQIYPAGGKRALIDGITGTKNFRDGHWQGFDGEDMSVILDLESRTKLKQISVSFLQNTGALIFLPSEIQIAVSKNGEDFETISVINNDVSQSKNGEFIKEFLHNFSHESFRYLRFYAKNIGVCPDWHPNAGEKCWIFADEIILW